MGNMDEMVREYLDVKARSPNTRRSYGNTLERFLRFSGGDFSEEMINRFLGGLQSSGLAGGSIRAYRKVILGFADFHELPVRRDRIIKTDSDPVREDVIPTQGEMARIFDNAGMRLKAVMAFQAFSALRFKPIAKLRLRHLRDLRITGGGVVVERTPMWIHIPKVDEGGRPFDKSGARHETFMIGEGVQYVLEWLNYRMRGGERLTLDSYVIGERRMRPSAVAKAVKRHFERLGFEARPYILKKYCENRMLTSGMKEGYQRFFSGWKAGRDLITRYGLSVALGPEQIDELRAEYAKAEPYLTTRPTADLDALRKEMEKKEEELRKEIVEEQRIKERLMLERIRALEREREEFKELIVAVKELKKRGDEMQGKKTFRKIPEQRVVDVEELPPHLSHGWRAVLTLPDGRIVVERA
ncbi:MAG: hypothetical protein ACE5Z5_11290 [Candidatus Bathyarchaeia archaeon]